MRTDVLAGGVAVQRDAGPFEPEPSIFFVRGRALGLGMAAGPTAAVGLSGRDPPRLPPSDTARKPAEGTHDVHVPRFDDDGHWPGYPLAGTRSVPIPAQPRRMPALLDIGLACRLGATSTVRRSTMH